MCSGSYRPGVEGINRRIMDFRRETNRGVFGLGEYEENLVFAYYGANSTLLYRQWVADGKRLPLETLDRTGHKTDLRRYVQRGAGGIAP